VGHLDGLEGLGEGADLVDLDEDRVGDAVGDAAGEALGVGDEEVVADELDAVADGLGEGRPAVPVVLAHPVLDRDDRVPEAQVREVVGHAGGRQGAALAGEDVLAAAEELGGGGVEGQRHVGARGQPGGLDRLEQELDGLLVGVQVRGEAALVPHGGREAPVREDLLEGVVALDAPAEALPERGRPDGHVHELLDVDVVVGVFAAVEDVEHRDGQHVGALASDGPVERYATVGGSGLRRGQ
jgi:hypothetical protein